MNGKSKKNNDKILTTYSKHFNPVFLYLISKEILILKPLPYVQIFYSNMRLYDKSKLTKQDNFLKIYDFTVSKGYNSKRKALEQLNLCLQAFAIYEYRFRDLCELINIAQYQQNLNIHILSQLAQKCLDKISKISFLLELTDSQDTNPNLRTQLQEKQWRQTQLNGSIYQIWRGKLKKKRIATSPQQNKKYYEWKQRSKQIKKRIEQIKLKYTQLSKQCLTNMSKRCLTQRNNILTEQNNNQTQSQVYEFSARDFVKQKSKKTIEISNINLSSNKKPVYLSKRKTSQKKYIQAKRTSIQLKDIINKNRDSLQIKRAKGTLKQIASGKSILKRRLKQNVRDGKTKKKTVMIQSRQSESKKFRKIHSKKCINFKSLTRIGSSHSLTVNVQKMTLSEKKINISLNFLDELSQQKLRSSTKLQKNRYGIFQKQYQISQYQPIPKYKIYGQKTKQTLERGILRNQKKRKDKKDFLQSYKDQFSPKKEKSILKPHKDYMKKRSLHEKLITSNRKIKSQNLTEKQIKENLIQKSNTKINQNKFRPKKTLVRQQTQIQIPQKSLKKLQLSQKDNLRKQKYPQLNNQVKFTDIQNFRQQFVRFYTYQQTSMFFNRKSNINKYILTQSDKQYLLLQEKVKIKQCLFENQTDLFLKNQRNKIKNQIFREQSQILKYSRTLITQANKLSQNCMGDLQNQQ